MISTTGSRPSRQDSMTSASASSGGGISSSVDVPPLPAAKVKEDEIAVKVKRRKSLDPGILRNSSTRRSSMFSSNPTKSREQSPESRRSSMRSSRTDLASLSEAGSSARETEALKNIKRSKSSTLLAKPSREQQEYIRKLFAEIPGPSPLAGLRIAQPPNGAESNGLSSLATQDHMTTGLYTCLMQFTSVEVLEGENAFQCRRCWKLVNSGLTAQVGRKRAARAANIQVNRNQNVPAEKHIWLDDAHISHALPKTPLLHKVIRPPLRDDGDSTPRPSFIGGIDSTVTNESAVAINRQLLEGRVVLDENLANTYIPPSQGPEIRLTSSSPSVSPRSPRNSENNAQTAVSRSSQLSATPRYANPESISSGASFSAGSTADISDAEPDADEEDFEPSASEAEGGSMGNKIQSHFPNAIHPSVSFADQIHQDRVSTSGALSAKSGKGALPLVDPMLPPRAQRYVSRRAHKRYLISALPPILVLHLKRFQQTSKSSLFGSFNNLKKLDDKVSFPLVLDMAPFMAPPPIERAHQSIDENALRGGESDSERRGRMEGSATKSHWFRRASPSAGMRARCQYRLYGVISHEGNMTSGHYVVHGKRNASRNACRVDVI